MRVSAGWYHAAMPTLSLAMITKNESASLAHCLASVRGLVDELVVVDTGSSDGTVAVAEQHGARVGRFPWCDDFSAARNESLRLCTGDWVLLLDADESLTPELAAEIAQVVRGTGAEPASAAGDSQPIAYMFPRRNIEFGRWIRHGGLYPDPKLRLMRRGSGQVEDCPVNEELRVSGQVGRLRHDMLHHAHRTIGEFMEHVNRYSSLAAQMKGPRRFSPIDIVVRPAVDFIYNYFFRLGFLDGPEGLLLHLCHAMHVSLKYAKAWELGRKTERA